MRALKFLIIAVFCIGAIASCFSSNKPEFVIAESKSYESSIYRQRCAICHGAEADGKTLVDGTVVPSLRRGQFKAVTPEAIYKQIADGGNGMLPFRGQLTHREMQMMAEFVQRDLRGR
jgi:mono/diheme cytochrome c family protein